MATTLTESTTPNRKRSFGLQHLILFTGIFAVSFACSFPSSHVPGRPNPSSIFWKIFLGFPEVTIGVLSLSGAAIVISRRRHEGERLTEPGRILFLLMAAFFVFSNVLESIYIFIIRFFEATTSNSEMAFAGLTYVNVLPPVFLAAICFCGFKDNRFWWRVAFFVLAIAHLSAIANTLTTYLMAVDRVTITANTFGSLRLVVLGIHMAAIAFILICCVIDLVKRVERSRMHWYGVMSFMICLAMPPISRIIVFRFLSVDEIFGR